MLAYNFDEERELLGPLGATEPVGEAGYSSLERLWHRPTLEVRLVVGGWVGRWAAGAAAGVERGCFLCTEWAAGTSKSLA